MLISSPGDEYISNKSSPSPAYPALHGMKLYTPNPPPPPTR